MQQINFTQEHRNELLNLSLVFLFDNILIGHSFNTKINVYDLIHNTSIGTLQNINTSLKKQISSKEDLDEWSLTDYQQNEIKKLKEHQKFINLLIGYKKFKAQQDSNQEKAKELEAEIKELEDSKKSPDDLIKEKKEKLAQLTSGNTAEKVVNTEEPVKTETENS